MVGFAVPEPPVTLTWAAVGDSRQRFAFFPRGPDDGCGIRYETRRGSAILTAGDIELGDSRGPRVVDGERLDAQKILAVGDARGECPRVGL